MLEPGDELVIWKLDRIGRNVLHALLTFQSLAERNVNIRSITDGVDLSTASGRYNFRNILSAAQYESDLNSERTLAGLAVARAKGGLADVSLSILMSTGMRLNGKLSPAAHIVI